MSRAPHPAIRPTLDALRRLPTLRQEQRDVNGLGGTFDLKLESEDRRYWICSAADAASTEALPPQFRPDHVTMDVLNPETETWDTFAYGLERTKELQMVDYFQLLGRRLDELLAQEAPDSPRETRRELEELRSEFLALRKLWGQEERAVGRAATPAKQKEKPRGRRT